MWAPGPDPADHRPLVAGSAIPDTRHVPPVPPDHDALHAALRAVIDRRDPEGLLALGAPPDEYAPETGDFARLHTGGGSFTPDTVTVVWERWFGAGSGFVSRASRAELEAFAADLEAAAGGARTQ